MTETYSKLFSSILGSSIWGEDDQVVRVWITMLAMKDHNGYVGASTGGLAHLARVPVEAVERALRTFLAPDPDSRSQEFEGRRIEVADRGWNVLNHDRFRDMRNEDDRRARDRDRKRRARLSASVRAVPLSSTHAESDAESDPPSIHPSTAPVRTAPVAPNGMDGMDGGAPHKSPSPEPDPVRFPQDLSLDGRRLFVALDEAGFNDRMSLVDRTARAASLEADGLTADQAYRLWAEAKRKGNKPGALFAKWLDSGTWRDVLADLGLAAKEAGLRSRAPTAVDVGPVFGEKPEAVHISKLRGVLSPIAPNPRDGMDPWTPSEVPDAQRRP